MKKHLAFIGIMAVVSFFIFNVRAHRAVLTQRASGAFRPNENVRHFESAAFIGVNDSNLWNKLDGRLTSLASTNATHWQHTDELMPEIKSFFRCYSQPQDFDSYMRFKSSGVPYEFSFVGQVSNIIRHAMTNDGVVFPTNSAERARMVWDTVMSSITNRAKPRITGVCVDRLYVVMVKTRSSNSPTLAVAGRATGTPLFASPTLISFNESKEHIRKVEGVVWYAIVGIPCQIDGSTNFDDAHFLHASFYWSAQSKRWLPDMLADDHGFILPAPGPPINFPRTFAFPVFY